MTRADVLAKARELVAGGWAEPFSRDSAGCLCAPDAEGLADYCLHDAMLAAAAGDVDAFLGAEAALVQQLRVASPLDVQAWLQEPKRTRQDVVVLLGRAAARARAKGG